MKKIHETRDGKKMPIASMQDDHLVNMCNIFFQRAFTLKNASKNQDDRFSARLYGVRVVNSEDAADLINEILDIAAPYFLEAYLRGLEDPRVMLETIYDRKTRLEGFDNTALMLKGNIGISAMAHDFEEEDEWSEGFDPEEGDR